MNRILYIDYINVNNHHITIDFTPFIGTIKTDWDLQTRDHLFNCEHLNLDPADIKEIISIDPDYAKKIGIKHD